MSNIFVNFLREMRNFSESPKPEGELVGFAV